MSRRCCRSRERRQRAWELWTPLHEISRIWAWWDYGDISKRTLATGISNLLDKGPKGYHLSQATGALQPTPSTLLGLPCATFANQWLDTGTSAILTGTGKMMAFMVGTMGSTSTIYGRALSFTKGNVSDYDALSRCAAILTDQTAGSQRFYTYCTAPSNTLTSVYGQPAIYEAIYTGATFGVALNGVSATPISKVTNWDINRVTVGKTYSENFYWNGQYGEMIVVADYDEKLRAKIEGYLAWGRVSWGIPSRLIASHKFKLRPPLVGD